MGRGIERAGYMLAWAGGLTYAAIFLIVLVNGRWPHFLQPIQSRFAIAGRFLGDFAFMAEIAVFVGPGLLLATLGKNLQKN